MMHGLPLDFAELIKYLYDLRSKTATELTGCAGLPFIGLDIFIYVSLFWESTYEDTQSYSDDDDDDDDEKYVQLPPPCVVAQLASISGSTPAVSRVKPSCIF